MAQSRLESILEKDSSVEPQSRVEKLIEETIENISDSGNSGSNEKPFKLIRQIMTTEDCLSIEVNTDENGDPFELKEIWIFGKALYSSAYISIYINNSVVGNSIIGAKTDGSFTYTTAHIEIFENAIITNECQNSGNPYNNILSSKNFHTPYYSGNTCTSLANSIKVTNKLTNLILAGSEFIFYGR